jgi:hypothetical protein
MSYSMSKKQFMKLFALILSITFLLTTIMATPASALISQNNTSWFSISDTSATATAIGDVNGDGVNELVTVGYANDGTRFVAQLFVWNAVTLVLERSTGWFWVSDTTVSSVAVANITGSLGLDIVTGGAFFDGTRWIAQSIVWNGISLTAEKITTWYWFGDTQISSVAVANVTGGTRLDIVTGGSFFDGTRNVAQLIVWNSSTMAAVRLTSWYWTSDTTVNSIAIANFTGGSALDIVTAGSYNDGLRNNAQVIDWNSSTLVASNIATWFTTSGTSAKSVSIGNFGLIGNRIVTGGSCFDGVRENAQLNVLG